jgi:AcrR family transcriptional regulator
MCWAMAVEQESVDPRARILQAALRQFAAHGFKGATIRAIAHDAGVSVGLLQYHFPSKEQLRAECDVYVFTFLRGALQQGVRDNAVADSGFVADTHHAVAAVAPYLATALTSNAPSASKWFDELAAWYREVLVSGEIGPPPPDDEDVDAIVAVYTAMQLGLTILAKHVYRQLGTDERDPSSVARIGRARLFLDREPLIDEKLAAAIRAGLDQYQHNSATLT